MKKNKWVPVVLTAVIIAAAVLAVGGFLLRGGTGRDAQSAVEQTPKAVDSASLILLVDETDYITGSEGKAAVSVLYSDEIGGEITVVDAGGQVLCTIENDGSGRGEALLTVPTQQDGCVRYQAVSGEHKSNQVTCYVHPEITAEMVHTLAAVSQDLGAFVRGQNFKDPLCADALDRVTEYLLSDQRVADAWVNSGVVLYATVDSLMGSYGLGAFDELSFGGFSEPEKTYRIYTAGKDVSQETLESAAVLTNKKCMYLSPLPEDHLVDWTKGGCVDKVFELSDAVGGDFTYAERERAWDVFESGAFTDAGFLTVVSHGKRLERTDGTYLFCFAMGQLDQAEFEEVFDENRLDAAKLWGGYDLEGEYVRSLESYRLLYNYNLAEPEASSILFATTNYLASVLNDRVFDNTIVYFAACHSAVDEELSALFLEHGAGAFIGSVPTLGVTVSYATFSALAEVLGSGGNLGEVQAKAASGVYNDEVLEWFNSSVIARQREYRDDLISMGAQDIPDEVKEWTAADIRADWAESGMVYLTRTSPQRLVLGTGTLSGTVVDDEGVPVGDAKVTIHRWLDHGYEEVAVTSTDQDGCFTLPDADWGLYGITAEKQFGKAGVTCAGYGVPEFSPDHDTAEPIVISFEPPMVFSACMGEYKGTIYKIGDVLDAEGIHIEPLPAKAPVPEMYICSFAFYRDQIYFCCKEPGTSGFHSELWVCDADGENYRKLKDDCYDFYIQRDELHCWQDDYYDIVQDCWKPADWTQEYMWGASQFFNMDCYYMYWPEDGVYRYDYRIAEDGTIDNERGECIFSFNAHGLAKWTRLELATERYLFLDSGTQNTASLCCYDMESGSTHILDEHIAAGSGYYFGW